MALGQYHWAMESNTPQDSESRHADKYIVRFPDGMRERLKNAAKANNRTLNAEIVARLQQSFEPHNDPNWQLRVAMHTNEVRLQTVGHHMMLLRASLDRIKDELELNGGDPQGSLRVELEQTKAELDRLHARNAELLDENAALERARSSSDREMKRLLDKIADGAIQEDLRSLHATEDRLGVLPQSRMAVIATPSTTPDRQPIVGDFSAYEKLLETALAKRDEKIRSWWQKEFGYDPEAPRVAQPASKGPTRSANAPKPLPKKKP